MNKGGVRETLVETRKITLKINADNKFSRVEYLGMGFLVAKNPNTVPLTR